MDDELIADHYNLIKYKELQKSLRDQIPSAFRGYFDKILVDNAHIWLMRYKYGNDLYFQGFDEDLYSDDIDWKDRFERRKLFLFLNGYALYQVRSIKEISLIVSIV